MREFLSDFLINAATPEVRDAVETAIDLFVRLDLPDDYETGFEELLQTNDSVEQGQTLVDIVGLTRNHQKNILAEHGVHLADDVFIDFSNAIIEGLLDIAEYDDKATVVRTTSLQSEMSSVEVFAELMSLVTPYSVEEILPYIWDVSTSLLQRIATLAAAELPVEKDASELERYSKYAQDLVYFSNHIVEPKLLTIQMVRDGMEVGQPFVNYIEVIGRDLEGLGVDKAAYELVAMSLISSDGHDSPHQVIKQHLEDFVANPQTLTKIDMKVGQLLLGMQQPGVQVK